jgi:V/A-type H+-transporting ATPase subunit A
MKVVGEEGTTIDDYVLYLKSEFVDSVYLQQNSFDPVDAAVGTERQSYVFGLIFDILGTKLNLQTKDEARGFFNQLRQRFLDMNGQEWQSESFKRTEKEIRDYFLEKKAGFDEEAGRIASRKR